MWVTVTAPNSSFPVCSVRIDLNPLNTFLLIAGIMSSCVDKVLKKLCRKNRVCSWSPQCSYVLPLQTPVAHAISPDPAVNNEQQPAASSLCLAAVLLVGQLCKQHRSSLHTGSAKQHHRGFSASGELRSHPTHKCLGFTLPMQGRDEVGVWEGAPH